MVAAVGFGIATQTAQAQTIGGDGSVYCASNDNRGSRCRVPWRYSELSQQLSSSSCTEGESWGTDPYSVWVKNGCRGNFVQSDGRRRDGWGGGWRPGRGDDDDRGGWRPGQGGGWGGQGGQNNVVRCESSGGRYQFCRMDIGRGDVRLVRQVSSADCDEGSSWGWRRDGIWVDNGCRADFAVDRRW
ncbi:DUF3011 domain-containing protein [Dyella tabacisoli]|uniref:DUF3011 domain-containing protein n=1 Tax=Dyella tabacisoli TaxID=2282381 RepID=UPI001CDC3DC6|nr:DUF3011 domain-containing protein [Dyella tabacisoli]